MGEGAVAGWGGEGGEGEEGGEEDLDAVAGCGLEVCFDVFSTKHTKSIRRVVVLNWSYRQTNKALDLLGSDL